MKFNLKKMRFSIIYSFDIAPTTPVKTFLPPQRKLWRQTEGDEEYGIDIWKKGKHRKLCAILTFEQFEKFIKHLDLLADSTPTGGSLGALGFGIGWAPAISFNNQDCQEGFSNAYVTPIPDEEPPEGDESLNKAWEEIGELIQERYGKNSFWDRNGFIEEDDGG